MLGAIITRGKTIQEAVHQAAIQLNVPDDAIDYEVIYKGSRTRLWPRPAVIQASVKKSLSEEAGLPQTASESQSIAFKQSEEVASTETELRQSTTEAAVWVRDGQVHCKNGSYNYALLTPSEDMVLRVNGHVVTGTSIVTEADQIEVELQDEHVPSQVNISISEDKMQVVLEIIPGYRLTRRLREQPPSSQISLEVTESKHVQNDVTQLLLYEKLTKSGVKYGFDHEQIKLACEAQEPSTYIVARGLEPTPGQDGLFELVSKEKNDQRDQFTLSDKIDWKERFSLPNVKAGEVVGRPIPAKPGVSGKNVLNQEIPAPPVSELTIVTGEGTVLYGDDQSVVATIAGRIKMQERSRNTLCFSILPQYVHNGSVNPETGNIRFRGDVYILGNIDEGMTVESGGNLHVTGIVTNATIITNGDAVITGPVIGSEIICGHTGLLWQQILPSFKLINQNLTELIVAARQLERNPAFSRGDLAGKGLQPLLKLLTEMKFKGLPDRIKEVRDKVKGQKNSFGPDVHKVVDFLEGAFLYFHPLASNIQQLQSFADFMDSVISSIEYDSTKKMNIQVQSLTSSSIESAWDVIVERFAYGSRIHCKGGLHVDGTLRGGSVQAGQFIEAIEIGSQRGSRTDVQVASNKGYVTAEFVGTDTTISISGTAMKLVSEEKAVNARLSDRGDLVLR
ncbi:FapA family protein [Alicyclobacillus dauci]|uniref:FapA family protein n=1 Tax=Alicyclobacillus dauci TaxID=1475485 RepID=A0ABY6Z1M8_9BACL|nr:FapA family protein [Alicyclobacillus dauci]WAH36792.1 FapA family protein [Alicyclobacillus dauci]